MLAFLRNYQGRFRRLYSSITLSRARYRDDTTRKNLIEFPRLKRGRVIPEGEHAYAKFAVLQEAGIIENIVPSLRWYGDEPYLHYFSEEGGYGSGVSIESQLLAYAQAGGEALERALWFHSDAHYRNKTVHSSYKQPGNRAIDLSALAGFSTAQRQQHSEIQYAADTAFAWTLAHSLTRKRQVFVPTQLMSAKYMKEHQDEPMLRWSISTGFATGESLQEALAKGILEQIERDSFIVAYLHCLTPPRIDLRKAAQMYPPIRALISIFEKHRLIPHAVLLPNDFGVHTVCGVLADESGKGPRITVGASAHFSQAAAITKALTEAAALRLDIRSNFRKALPELARFGKRERIRYWAQKESADSLSFFMSGEVVSPAAKSHEVVPRSRRYWSSRLQMLVRLCCAKGYEVVCAEMTPRHLAKKTGLRSVFTLIPKLQPLHLNERIPYHGGERLETLSHLAPDYTPARAFNAEPHPFP